MTTAGYHMRSVLAEAIPKVISANDCFFEPWKGNNCVFLQETEIPRSLRLFNSLCSFFKVVFKELISVECFLKEDFSSVSSAAVRWFSMHISTSVCWTPSSRALISLRLVSSSSLGSKTSSASLLSGPPREPPYSASWRRCFPLCLNPYHVFCVYRAGRVSFPCLS